MIANTFVKELNIKLSTTDLRNVTRDTPLPGFNDKIIIPNPSLNNNGWVTLKTTTREWKSVTSGFDSAVCEIHSDCLLYIKIETDNNNKVIIQSKSFSYNNPELPVKISVANGTLSHDPITDVFVTNVGSKDTTAYFISINYTA